MEEKKIKVTFYITPTQQRLLDDLEALYREEGLRLKRSHIIGQAIQTYYLLEKGRFEERAECEN